MSKIKLIVDGGKAVANPQFAQALGPLGIMQNVLNDINKKTVDFKGIKVPVEIDVNKDKTYNIIIGTPSASELIKGELKVEKGSGYPNLEKVGNVAIQDVIKIAKMKRLGLLANNLKSAIKTILGTCNQMGVLVENKDAKEVSKDVENGVYDKIILKEEIEVSSEKRSELKKTLDETNQKLSEKLKKKKEEEELKEKKATGTPTEGAAPAGEAKPAAAEKVAEKKSAEKKEAKK